MGATSSRRGSRASSGITLTCPVCSEKFTNELSLVQHYNQKHPSVAASNPSNNTEQNTLQNNNKFKIGDRVLAMWVSAKWQYFPATIVREIDGGRKYEINWDDGDTTGRKVDSCNIYHNISPNEPRDMKVGNKVLFQQGSYSAGGTQVSGGERWHEGVITDVQKLPGGVYRFNGHHTKGVNDGKGIGYGGYSYNFKNYSANELRLSSVGEATSISTETNLVFTRASTTQNNSSASCSGGVFKIGDRVLAMWVSAKWQYFPATIVREIDGGRKYKINWDDGDTTGRIVESHNIYHNTQPNPSDIEVGVKVLFTQGSYRAGDTQTSGGERWHEGVITSVNGGGGLAKFSGHHTKGATEGKSVAYRSYQYKFTNYSVTSLRLSTSSTLQTQNWNNLSTTTTTASTTAVNNNNNYIAFNTGEHVLAMWSLEMWQYFPATTVRQIQGTNQYEINWDDGDTTG